MTAFGRTWIVALDDSRARFMRRESSGEWTQPAAESLPAAPKPATPEARRKTREEFVRQVITTVDTACDHNRCDSIVVMGPERLLQSFRKAATDRVRVRLWRERASEVGILSQEEIIASVQRYFDGA